MRPFHPSIDMPGRLFQTRPAVELSEWLGCEASVSDEPPRANIAPGQDVMVLDREHQLVRMRWGVVPVGRVNARGRPVLETIVNARSETVFEKSAFEGVQRAIVPVEGWYEWTGEKRRKTAWRIRHKSEPFLLFAAISDRWEAPGGRIVDQVATLTTEPNRDIAEIHHRMGVLLTRECIAAWLTGDDAVARSLCKPFPDGLLQIEEAKDVDWTGV